MGWGIQKLLGMCLLAILSWAAQAADDLSQIYSPVIVGDRLIIKGHIDSHIYDYFSLEAARLTKIKVIEFNSYGGKFDVALAVAQKIRALHVTTKLSSGSVCASACVAMYAAGDERLADSGTWFGIHGTRLTAGLANSFLNACYDGDKISLRLKTCETFVAKWKPLIEKSTDEQFSFYESVGVSRALRATYYALPDDPNWYEQMNLLKKPDFVLPAEEAYNLYLVTQLNSFVTVSLHEN